MGGKGVYKWTFTERITVALLNFGGNIALTRMLTEADFGLLAMIAIFIVIASDLSNCGLADGLIHKLHPTQKDYSTVFVINAGMGLFFGTLFFLGAPLFAEFYRQPALLQIMRVAGVCFFIQCLCGVQETLLRKQLRMRDICLVRIAATASALGLGIFLAAKGFGYWALASTQLFLSVFMFIYYLVTTRWIPKLMFDVKAFRQFFSYGVHLMLSYIGVIVSRNINTSVLGKAISSSASGVYYQGAKLGGIPFSITESSLNSPFFVVASNEPDDNKRRNLILDMMLSLMGANAFILSFLLVIASPAVLLMYGDKWAGVIPVLRILAFYEFMAAIKFFCVTICKVYDRTTTARNITFLEITIQLCLLAIFVRGGILWVAWSQTVAVFVALIIYLCLSKRLLCIGLKQLLGIVLSAVSMPAAVGLITLVVSCSVQDYSVIVRCAVICITYIAVLVAIGETLHPRVYMVWRKKLLRKKNKSEE